MLVGAQCVLGRNEVVLVSLEVGLVAVVQVLVLVGVRMRSSWGDLRLEHLCS